MAEGDILTKRQKLNFNDLPTKSEFTGDAVYERQKEKLRDKKMAKKS